VEANAEGADVRSDQVVEASQRFDRLSGHLLKGDLTPFLVTGRNVGTLRSVSHGRSHCTVAVVEPLQLTVLGLVKPAVPV
jgi:hypothetical protein